MVTKIKRPVAIQADGHPPKLIEEYIGNINSNNSSISIAKMISPGGWSEPGQTPEFVEYTVVLKGQLQVETRSETFIIEAGQAVEVSAGEWVRYSTPSEKGAEYIAVCLPAFSPDTVHRDQT